MAPFADVLSGSYDNGYGNGSSTGVNAQGIFADSLSGSYDAGYNGATTGQSSISSDQPGRDPLIIGPVMFTSRECPSKLEIGAGKANISDVEITGGTRIIQNLGAFWKNVRFSGTLWENADARVALLDGIRTSCAETLITWRSKQFFGFVVDFTPGYRNAYRCEYEIELCITRVSPSSPTTQPPGLDAVVGQASANAAQSYQALTAADPSAATAIPPVLIANVNQSVSTAGPLASVVGSKAGANILAACAAASDATNRYMQAKSSLDSGYVAATTLANSLVLLGRNISQGQSPRIVQQLGGNAFEAAVAAYGSIDAALALCDANNTASAHFPSTSLTTLTLPPLAA